MSKRFTETDKWKDPWFRDLSLTEKVLFNYFCDNCNLGGFIELDFPGISFQTGIAKDAILGAVQGLNRGCIKVDNWIWVRTFLRHQKNENLNPENNAHKNIITRIKEQINRFSDNPEFLEFLSLYENILGAKQPLFRGTGKGIDKGNGINIKEGIKFEKVEKPEIEDIETRESKFLTDLEFYKADFPIETIKAFFLYWSEKTTDQKKMRFEKEKTWELGKRLSKWQSNNFNKNNNGKPNITKEGLRAAFAETFGT